jgi:4'-phosphopantetheinyl transferase
MIVFDESKVNVYWAEIARQRDRLDALGAHLSADERDRAARFRLAPDRERYVVARGLLRELLAQHLGVAPRDPTFAYNRWGKPSLSPPSPLELNVAHTRGLIGLAFTLGRKVGIDVERLDRTVNAQKLADRFFTPAEAAALRRLDERDRPAAFLRSWTRKEAFVKAHGEGLSRSLEPEADERSRWTTVDAPCPERYVASVCAEAGAWRLEVTML